MKKLIEALKEKLGEDVLSEDMINDIQAQFDVLVNEKVQSELETKEAELAEKSETEMTEFKDSLIESLDKYIEYASDEYLKENEVAIEAGAKVLAAEKIIEAARGVFNEVGLEIPESEVDHVKDLEAKLAESTEKLNELIEKTIDEKKQTFEYEKAISFQKMTSELAESKVEKVFTLLEGLEYTDIDDFDRKVKIVIGKVTTKLTETTETDDDDLEDLEEETKISNIDKYL